MQELTRVALLAQPAEPVFAYCGETFAIAGVRGELFWGLEVLGGGGGVAQGGRRERGKEGDSRPEERRTCVARTGAKLVSRARLLA